jgi:hypothetical protein
VIILTSKKSEKKYAKEISALGYYQITTRADEVVEFIYKHTPGKSSK